jgi:HAMP domain-containing protein
METIVTSADVLMYLQITVAVLLVIVLYHVLFITVDLRKVLRRLEGITNEVENIIMKPISAADQILEAILGFVENQSQEKPKKKKVSKKKK